MAKVAPRVLLGFVDEPVTESCPGEQSFTVNKIGGLPDTPEQDSLLPKCPLCDCQVPLLVQVYAPSTNSIYHRTLYVHACVNPGCWNKAESWICIRRQWIATSENDEQQRATFIDWCSDADDWGEEPAVVEENGNVTGNTSQAMESGTSTSAELEISDADENVVAESIKLPNVDVLQLLDSRKEIPFDHHDTYFEPYYISVSYEDSSDGIKEHAINLLDRYQNNDTILENKNEVYEKSLPAHGDKYFETFISTIRKYPGQVLRYCRNEGKPLFLYEDNEPIKCCNCQGKLSFEFQILPSLITYLKLKSGKDHHGSGHLEFGTALIYTCDKNCWTKEDTLKYEHVLIQEEKIF